ncbi:MAG: cell division protein FtsL [Candidatus Desulforudis sp.]|nr:cell division protein FtsL [Desulforudis sp.]
MIAARERADHYYKEFRATERSETRFVPGKQVRLFITAMVVVVFVLGVAFSYVNALAVNVGYQAERLNVEIARLDAERQSLRTAIDKLDTLPRVEVLAMTELGMVRPTPDNTLFVALGGGNGDSDLGAAPGKEQAMSVCAIPEDGSDTSEQRRVEAREPGILQAFLDFVAR